MAGVEAPTAQSNVTLTFRDTKEEAWHSLEPFEKVSVDEVRAREEEAAGKAEGSAYVVTAEAEAEAEAEGKAAAHKFRNYADSDRQNIVEWHYKMMRQNQTVDFVDRMYAKWHNFDHGTMTIAEAFEKLGGYIDSSDPDADFPNLEHCMQTAEGIRKSGHPEWFQLVGLIHDMGKIMFLWGNERDGQHGHAHLPQWALGGDTWVVGCRLPDCAVFPEFNALNPDAKVYTTKQGVYEPGCGLENLRFAYGHDEYMYRMLVHNRCMIPKEGLAMIRYHSCYPWHDKGEYGQFETEEDKRSKPWVKEFNKFDLYTKSNERPDVKALWPHYQRLIDKFCPGKLQW